MFTSRHGAFPWLCPLSAYVLVWPVPLCCNGYKRLSPSLQFLNILVAVDVDVGFSHLESIFLTSSNIITGLPNIANLVSLVTRGTWAEATTI